MDEEIRNGNIEGARKLLNASGLQVHSDWKDNCLLRAAIRHKQTDAVKILLQKVPLCEKIPRGFELIRTNLLYTPLHLAVRLDYQEIIEILVSKGASLYAKNTNQETPLILAAAMGNHSITDQILSFNPTEKNCSRKDGFSHFHIACMRNRVDIARRFLQEGVDINSSINLKSSYCPGYTALHFAAEFQCVKTVELLVNCGADITVKNSNELTPLHLAFRNQNETIIDLILSAHSYVTDANPEDSEGLSHFHIACSRNDPKIVQSFLHCGVDIDLKINSDVCNWSGYTPLRFAVEYECIDVVKLLLSMHDYICDWSIVDLAYRISNVSIFELIYSVLVSGKSMATERYLKLIDFPIDISIYLAASWRGSTPLHVAVQWRDLHIVRFVIGMGEWGITAKDTRGKTALHLAFENKENLIVDLLLSAHVNVKENPMDNQGLSHFHIAVARDNLSIVNHFLKNGVDINSQVSLESVFWPGYTALHFACNFKCKKVAELLLNHNNALITFKNGLGLTPLELFFTKIDFHTHEEYDSLIEIEIIDLILSGPEDNYSHYSTDSGLSFFHVACARSNTALVKRLSNPQKINQAVSLPNWSGRTPLHFAAYFDNQEVIKLLLQLGADRAIEDANGYDALALWRDKYHSYQPSRLLCEDLLYYTGDINSKAGLFHFFTALEYQYPNAVEYFLKGGINVNTISGYTCCSCMAFRGFLSDCTALHAALCGDDSDDSRTVQILLKYGANIHQIDPNKNTPLHIATKCPCLNSNRIKLLLNEGADCDVNAQNIRGDTPLHTSCKNGFPNIFARLLLENGADLNIENNEGQTPLANQSTYRDPNARLTVLLLNHVKKLQIVGLPMNEKNAREYNRLVDLREDDNEELEEDVIVSLCESEINGMKMIKLSSNTTLHDVIFKDTHGMALLVMNTEFRRILELEDVIEKFPNYGYLLKLQFRKGSKRRELLLPGQAAVRFLSGIRLPDDCSEHIIQYLTDESLESVVEAVGNYYSLDDKK